MVKTNLFPVQLKQKYSIILTVSGSGTATCEPFRCEYPSSCNEGTNITITAVPDEGWAFEGWTGDYIGTDNPASLTLNSDMTVTAVFTQNQVLSELLPSSVYNSTDPATGEPWESGKANANIANIDIQNVGSMTGIMEWRCYAHADEAGETLLGEGTTASVNPGEYTTRPITVNLPDEPGQTIQFGIKTKGETETDWPSWGTGMQLGKAVIWNRQLEINPYLAIGLIAIGAGILYLIFRKKK